jgi:hypothetical protein
LGGVTITVSSKQVIAARRSLLLYDLKFWQGRGTVSKRTARDRIFGVATKAFDAIRVLQGFQEAVNGIY